MFIDLFTYNKLDRITITCHSFNNHILTIYLYSDLSSAAPPQSDKKGPLNSDIYKDSRSLSSVLTTASQLMASQRSLATSTSSDTVIPILVVFPSMKNKIIMVGVDEDTEFGLHDWAEENQFQPDDKGDTDKSTSDVSAASATPAKPTSSGESAASKGSKHGTASTVETEQAAVNAKLVKAKSQLKKIIPVKITTPSDSDDKSTDDEKESSSTEQEEETQMRKKKTVRGKGRAKSSSAKKQAESDKR